MDYFYSGINLDLNGDCKHKNQILIRLLLFISHGLKYPQIINFTMENLIKKSSAY